jgi:CheY-like chemotaxis protein
MNHKKSHKILIVDESLVNLRFLTKTLAKQGYKVRGVDNSTRALKAAQLESPDLVLLNIKKSKINCDKICQVLKATQKTAEIPIIFINGFDEVINKVKMFEIGEVDYITHPFKAEELLARVKTHLALQNMQKQLKEKNIQLEQATEKWQRQEEELQKLKEATNVANRAKSDFFTHINHKLRTPLNAILGYTQLFMQDKKLMETYGKRIERIHRNGECLLMMIKELLEVSQTKAANSEQKQSNFPEKFSQPQIDVEKKINTDKSHITGYRGKKCQIMIVDDKPENRYVLEAFLQLLNFEITEAENGYDALNRINKSQPNLILLDLVMPGMNGYQFVRYIRKIPVLKNIIVIAISASASKQTQQAALISGCNDFIAKPIETKYLLERLQIHLELEWIYEDKKMNVLIIPPRRELETLLNNAKRHNITNLKECIKRIKALDSQFIPFIDQTEPFLETYQFKKLIKFLEPYLEDTEAK